jgi:hypothetical protein
MVFCDISNPCIVAVSSALWNNSADERNVFYGEMPQ